MKAVPLVLCPAPRGLTPSGGFWGCHRAGSGPDRPHLCKQTESMAHVRAVGDTQDLSKLKQKKMDWSLFNIDLVDGNSDEKNYHYFQMLQLKFNVEVKGVRK